MFRKRFLTIVGNLIPAVIISEPQTEDVVLPRTGRIKKTQFAWVITLRTTLDGVSYLQQSYEDIGFLPPRGDTVVGLDVAEDGSTLSIETLGLLMAQNQADRQTTAAATPAAVAVDVG